MSSTLRMLRAQFIAEQRIFWRNVSTMFFTFVMPMVLLLLVTFGGGGEDALAVVVALGVLSTGFQGLAMQLAMHRDQGVLKGLVATPLPPLVFVAAKVLSLLVVVALEAVVIVLVGTTFTDVPAPQQPLLLAVLLVLGTFAFAAIGFAVASVIPTSDSAPAIVNAAYLGLILATFLFAQVDALPEWAAAIGGLLPLEPLFESIRGAWLGVDVDVARSIAVLAGWGVAATAWTVRRFRWEPREAIS